MSTQESSLSDQSPQYLSKRVKVNGQFVTLYSLNGLTWLSSPEDIPNTMARLDHSLIAMSEAKPADGEKAEKGDKGEKVEKKGDKPEKEAAPPPKVQSSQYRMKGPRPRPILRQGGKVVQGTPIEPVSASSVNIKGAPDTVLPTVKLSPMEKGLRRGKIVAPLAQRRPAKAKVAPPASKKVAAPVGKSVPAPKDNAVQMKLAKTLKAAIKPAEKGKKVAAPIKVAAVKAAPVKAAKAAAAPKKVAKPVKAVKKVVAKKPILKKSVSKGGAKKRSR